MKTYPCPYCGNKFNKIKMVPHIEKEHDDMLPVGYTAYRATYDLINDKHGHGDCTVCGKPTKWNPKTNKYNRLCGSKECAKKVKETYRKRMMKVYNKVHLLDDPEQQKKMLAGRHISGVYVWSDGTKFNYVGSFEKSFLEFLDQVMHFQSGEIVAPGPTLEYDDNGTKRKWILDFLILPYNLCVDVKDGGDNPNTRNMPIYRSKQLAKEKMITNLGTYSYIRLTNNQFEQFFSMLAELKKKVVDEEEGPLYRIHEEDIESHKAIGSTIVNELSRITDNSPIISMTESCSYHINEEGDLYLEVATLRSKMINKSFEESFDSAISSLVENCSLPLVVEPLDETNPLSGYSIGFVV